MDDFFKVTKRGRLAGHYPKRGEITIHTYEDGRPSGAIILRCPLCGGLQHKAATVSGPDDAPTIEQPIKCSCVRCEGKNTTFLISAGKVYMTSDPAKPATPELTREQRDAGVFYPSERGWIK